MTLALWLPLDLTCQTSTTGALSGIVTDPSQAVLPDAFVEIRDMAKGTVHSTKTDTHGGYRLFFLVPGRYALTIGHTGIREERREVNVLLGPPVSVNITLQIAEAQATLTVTDEAPLIQAENGDISATLNQMQISELPNPGNDLTYIVQTAPGVVMNTDVQGLANFSILGMPGFSYLHTIDGMNDNDNGISLSMVGPLTLLLGENQIEETTVVSTGYSGQFGGAAGGNINYVTKSGGNQFHGNAQYYWNGRVFNANTWFNNAFVQPRPFSIANQWAGSFGGPLKKKKLFFFFDTEGLRLLIPQQFFVTVPSLDFETATIAHIDAKFPSGSNSASHAFYQRMFDLYNAAPGAASAMVGTLNKDDLLGCQGFIGPNGLGTDAPCVRTFIENRGRPSQDTLTSGRLDWNVSPNSRAFVRLQYDRGRSAWVTDPISSLFDVDNSDSWWQAQVIETHSFGSSVASQFLLGGSYFSPVFAAPQLSQSLAAFPTTLSFVQGSFNNLGAAENFNSYIGQLQITEDIAKTWANHKLGFGANLVRTHWNRPPNLAATAGQLNVQSLNAFYEGGFDASFPDRDFTTLSQSFTSENRLPVTFLNFAAYGEDEWRARPELTLTFALRAEHYSNPACESRCFARLASPFPSGSHDPAQPYDQAILVNQRKAFSATDMVLWSPRFSFAWQPFRTSRNTVIRGGIGIFYDPLPGLIVDSFSNSPPLYNSYNVAGNNLAPGESASLFKDAAAANTAFVGGFAAGQTLAQIKIADPNFFPPAISVPESHTHFPQYQKWSLEWQQALGTEYLAQCWILWLPRNPRPHAEPKCQRIWIRIAAPGLCASPAVPPCADPRFSEVTEILTKTVSTYAGMVASFRHRFHRWTEGLLQANYTYGHALDESGGLYPFTGASLSAPQDPNNLRGSYASADHDVRHSFNANYVWELPLKAVFGGRGPQLLVNGWQVSGTIFARSGFPYTVFDFEQSGILSQRNYFGLLYAVPAGPLASDSTCDPGAAVPLAAHPARFRRC